VKLRGVAVVALALVACRAPPPPAPPPEPPPHLRPPPALDPAAPHAAYLTALALQLQPGWGQFLDDCRLRLPATHPLNRPTLAATATIEIDRAGKLAAVALDGSGDADFDRALHAVIADAELPAPPPDALSDDDRAHVRWLFARDRRQAGPATARVLDVRGPLDATIARLVAAGELARAAERVTRAAPDDPARAAATARVMVGALREALAGSIARREAIDAIGRARVIELAGELHPLLGATETELRLAAIEATTRLGDDSVAAAIAAHLPADLHSADAQLALVEVRALVALGHRDDAAVAIRVALGDGAAPSPVAIAALSLAPVADLAERVAAWRARGDARVRAAACTAAAALPLERARALLVAGLHDADATARASCVATAALHGRALAAPLRELVRDRDRAVRARAVAALVSIDRAPRGTSDPAPEVRAAVAAPLSDIGALAELRALADDRDPDVRAAAWRALAGLTADRAPPDRAALAQRAVADPSAAVRLAAIDAIDDDATLARIAAADEAPDVRTAALVRHAGRRGRAAVGDELLARVAAAPPGHADRVRAALAWLLAR
jgi:hypothetical protein